MPYLLPNDEVSRDQLKGYIIFLWAHDHPHPAHVHIRKGRCRSAWDLSTLRCVHRGNFSSSEIREHVQFSSGTGRRSGEAGMRTGKTKTAEKLESPLRATGLRFDKARIVVILDDDREISLPLTKYPSLLKASGAERRNWEIIGDGDGFHWESLNLDLSTYGLVNGIREGIPRPPKLSEIPFFKQPKRRSA
jgi:hypothetical protein